MYNHETRERNGTFSWHTPARSHTDPFGKRNGIRKHSGNPNRKRYGKVQIGKVTNLTNGTLQVQLHRECQISSLSQCKELRLGYVYDHHRSQLF